MNPKPSSAYCRIADTGLALAALADGLAPRGPEPIAAWRASVHAEERAQWDKMARELESDTDPPNPLRVCAEVAAFVRPGDVVIGDGGDFVGTAAYILKTHGVGTWMDPGPLGTLGVGPGFAMAARLLRPDARVIVMFGDGSFGLHAMELEAMQRQGLPVVAIIGNDAGWTQIRRGQVQMYGEERSVATGLSFTRYDRVVEALGGHGEYVERPEDIRPAMERALGAGKPALVNIRIGSSDFRKDAISI